MSNKKENPLIVEMNRRNREFWDDITKTFESRIEQRPADLKLAVKRFQNELDRGVPLKMMRSLEAEVLELKALEQENLPAIKEELAPTIVSELQAARASKPRKPHVNPIRDFIIKKLRRNRQATAKEILSALEVEAENGNDSGAIQISNDGLSFVVKNDDGSVKNRLSKTSIDATVARLRKTI